MTNKQLYDKNEDMIVNEDEILDEILDNVKVTHQKGQQIDKTVQDQKPMIKDIGGGMNNISHRMERANNKIKVLIHRQSYCKLYVIILIEVIIFFLLLFL